MTFLNATLLFGFGAVAVPLAIHFLSRTKYDEVDWGAMRFLTPSSRTRKRKRFDNLLLLLLRGGVIASLALALAAPTVPGSALPSFARGGPKDVILLLDNSASTAGSGTDAIKAAAKAYVTRLRDGDRVAVFAVRRSPTPLASAWANPASAVARLALLPPPAGTADWPAGVASAVSLFDDPTRERHVVGFGDGQRYGLADEATVARWPLAVPAGELPPRVWYVPISTDRAAGPAATIEPIAPARGVIVSNRDVAFTTTVRATGGRMPPSVNVEWDGRPAGTVPVAPDGRVNVSRRFAAGSHVLTLRASDARQDYAFEVVAAVPVLVLDGDPKGEGRGVRLLKAALAPEKDPAPGFAVRVAPAVAFGPVTLRDDVAGRGTPRVVVLANVASLTAEQNRAVESFLKDGGGVLVLPGDRVDAAKWNAVALRGGQGWLPARLDRPVETTDARPRPGVSSHPAFAAFREPLPGGLHAATFPTYWKLDPTVAGPGTTVAASFSTGDPFLVDRGVGRGRVMLAAVPFDSTWDSGFPAMPDYVRLLHELTYALAATGTGERNLNAGTPISFTPKPDEPPAGVTVAAPEAAPRVVPVAAWPVTYADTHVPGVYPFTTAAGRTTYFAVRGDPRETDVTPLDEADRTALANAGVAVIADAREVDATRPVSGGPKPRSEIGGWVLLAVLVMCLGEWWVAGREQRSG